MTYQFRREDNGQLIEVNFETMMQKVAGVITLPDGATAREVRTGWRKAAKAIDIHKPEKTIVSDALGFGQHQLDAFEEDRKRNGFTGVEFRRDPQVPEFFQVHISGRKEHARYVRHRGFTDKNGGNGSGAMLSEDQMQRARAAALEQYPV